MSYKPTNGMVDDAKRGLKAREDAGGKGGLDTREAGAQGIGSGVARARDIAAGKSLSLETVKQMARWYSRHKKNYTPGDATDKGTISHWLWGFPSALGWVRDILRREGVEYDLVKQLDDDMQVATEYKISKVDTGLGLVFGWGQVCKERTEKGLEDFYDSDNDCLAEEGLVEAWDGLMSEGRVLKANHRGKQIGDIVFAFPFTEEIAKSLGFDVSGIPRTGAIVGVRPQPEIFAKYVSGEWDSFSVGGTIIEMEEA
ncbi:hypothetical protein 13VV501A_gene0023 [Vibrio phage 13VV501A]|nr:hypothetical protein 13VV501A_gene0023 [Vibrio phage 13VV501A]